MTEQKNALAQLFAACWKDEALKARFMADPKAVLKEHGLDVPDGMDVKVVENADDCVHITLPAPPAGDMDLSDEELSNAAGGTPGLTEQQVVQNIAFLRDPALHAVADLTDFLSG